MRSRPVGGETFKETFRRYLDKENKQKQKTDEALGIMICAT